MKTKDARKSAVLESLKGGLIVSCQVQKDDPIYTDDIVVKMAEDGRVLLVFVRILQNRSVLSKKQFQSFL